MTEVFLNGKYVGEHDKPESLVGVLVEKRRKGLLPSNMNVAFHKDKDEVQINMDAGRVRRPLIVVEAGKPKLTKDHVKQIEAGKLTWKELADASIIEYVDTEEEENLYVALKPEDVTKEHTHLELDPMLMIGAAASILVYPEKNRGDRLNYGSRMAVQAMGIPMHNFLLRTDTTMNVLVYPQAPLVRTESMEAVGLQDHPCGQNLVIAIMPFHGYNIEDALILNKASLERGLGRSIIYRGYSTEGRRYWGGQEDALGVPDKNIRGYRTEEDYSKLDRDGIIFPETDVKENDVLVGKTSPLRFLGITKEVRIGIQNYRENSLTTNNGTYGVVEKVVLTKTDGGNRLVNVMVRDTRIPEIGDKLATRHGQKGVIGLVVPEEEMPHTASGIRPDIIINPHAIPSRMTVGQLLEILSGKTGAMSGTRMDGTIFRGDEESIRSALKSLGFRDDGKEVMYSGITGEKMECPIFIGICYYQRLYHLVSKKIHARSRGPVALLTKQPTEGRSKEGGLRLGEMEKDCFVAHGAAMALKERFGSDRVSVPVCKECGAIAVDNKMKNKTYCPVCKGEKTVMVEMSYAFKLMLDELRSMTLNPQIIPEEE